MKLEGIVAARGVGHNRLPAPGRSRMRSRR
jgi:hypothetical protein